MNRYRQLTSGERYALSALRKQGCNQAAIARALGRHRSTIAQKAWAIAAAEARPMRTMSVRNQPQNRNASGSNSSQGMNTGLGINFEVQHGLGN